MDTKLLGFKKRKPQAGWILGQLQHKEPEIKGGVRDWCSSKNK